MKGDLHALLKALDSAVRPGGSKSTAAPSTLASTLYGTAWHAQEYAVTTTVPSPPPLRALPPAALAPPALPSPPPQSDPPPALPPGTSAPLAPCHLPPPGPCPLCRPCIFPLPFLAPLPPLALPPPQPLPPPPPRPSYTPAPPPFAPPPLGQADVCTHGYAATCQQPPRLPSSLVTAAASGCHNSWAVSVSHGYLLDGHHL